jgi:Asp-tRNA(Asn)/Glu-tRNA(Gln) amidotransferase C subunit
MMMQLVLNEDEDRVFYTEIKPILDYIEKILEVNPTRVLNQYCARYESGELKTVSKKIYDYALKLKKRAENALSSGSKFDVEKIQEEIYGKREGFILYSELEEELEFLNNYGGKSLRQYLGRSISYYKKSQLKRIASWRAQKIKNACSELINNKPELALISLPKSHARMRIKKLLSVLKSYLIARIIEDEDGIERLILTPAYYSKERYETEKYGFTSMHKTAYFLGMSKTAFDLLVIAHLDMFRRITTYNKGWYLPYLYLKKLKEKKGFDLIKAKYEVLAKNYKESHRPVENKRQSINVSNEKASRQMEKTKQACTVEIP